MDGGGNVLGAITDEADKMPPSRGNDENFNAWTSFLLGRNLMSSFGRRHGAGDGREMRRG